MKKIFIVLILLLNVAFALAHGDAIAEGKELVESKVGCDNLTNEQLEEIGEYLMEQMHPGQSHEAMHEMMGLTEGSEAEEQFHIKMANALHCGDENVFGSGGMMDMGMMNMMVGGGMMGGQNMQGSMMGNFGSVGYWSFTNIVYVILLIGLIILVYVGIYKLWLWEPKHKKENKED